MQIVGLIPAVILFAASLLAAIFSPWWGGLIYVGGTYGVTVIMFGSCACVRAPYDPIGVRKMLLSDDEERLFKKYYAFFKFPLGTQNLSHFVNYARMFGIIWIAMGIWEKLYWVAIANVVFYLISISLMWRLSPLAHYRAAAEKGLTWAVLDLTMMQHILERRDELGF
jgi:hypothetical protein